MCYLFYAFAKNSLYGRNVLAVAYHLLVITLLHALLTVLLIIGARLARKPVPVTIGHSIQIFATERFCGIGADEGVNLILEFWIVSGRRQFLFERGFVKVQASWLSMRHVGSGVRSAGNKKLKVI